MMGAGIGAMHYSGMAAMLPQALLRYDPPWAAVSIVTAVGLAFVSLSIRCRFRWSAIAVARSLAGATSEPIRNTQTTPAAYPISSPAPTHR